jgi:hypothetical protein
MTIERQKRELKVATSPFVVGSFNQCEGGGEDSLIVELKNYCWGREESYRQGRKVGQ